MIGQIIVYCPLYTMVSILKSKGLLKSESSVLETWPKWWSYTEQEYTIRNTKPFESHLTLGQGLYYCVRFRCTCETWPKWWSYTTPLGTQNHYKVHNTQHSQCTFWIRMRDHRPHKAQATTDPWPSTEQTAHAATQHHKLERAWGVYTE